METQPSEHQYGTNTATSPNMGNSPEKKMALPDLHTSLRVYGQIAAVIGCLGGAFLMYQSTLQFSGNTPFGGVSVAAGIFQLGAGVVVITLSLVMLGILYGFLAIVEALVDIRNATVRSMQMTEAAENV